MIEQFGWDSTRESAFARFRPHNLVPARVIAQHRGRFRLATSLGECAATLSGRYAFDAAPGEFPVTGDWIAGAIGAYGEQAVIHDVLPRTTVFVRHAVGRQGGQVVAANIDIALLVASLNADFNIRRLERYLAVTREGGARPLIVLTKADLCLEPGSFVEQCRSITAGDELLTVSAITGQGMAELRAHLAPGKTAALLGSSGVGKSSLVNALVGRSTMATTAIRGTDDRGRHTTTHRELIVLPSGAALIDTPGMRELGLWDAETGVADAFADIAGLGIRCRFRDCRHDNEPGCAVREAIEIGAVDPARWRSYCKLQREASRASQRRRPRPEGKRASRGAREDRELEDRSTD